MAADTGSRMPVLFVSHGPGPAWLLDGAEFVQEQNSKCAEATFLKGMRKQFLSSLPPIRAVLVLSAHWVEDQVTVQDVDKNKLYFDYYNMPPKAYQLQWPAPGAPDVAKRARKLLEDAGIPVQGNTERGLDHGVFIPLMLIFKEADVPVFQVSLKSNMDLDDHLALGEALAPLRDEGVLIVGSGSTTHNGSFTDRSKIPDWAKTVKNWIHDTLQNPRYSVEDRKARLSKSKEMPNFKDGHPTAEHFIPIPTVAAAAGYAPMRVLYENCIMGGLYTCHYLFED